MEISANLTLAAEALAVWVRYRALCSHLLVDKSLGIAKVQNRMVTKTLMLEPAELKADVLATNWEGNGNRGELQAVKVIFSFLALSLLNPQRVQISEGKQPFFHPAMQWQKRHF